MYQVKVLVVKTDSVVVEEEIRAAPELSVDSLLFAGRQDKLEI